MDGFISGTPYWPISEGARGLTRTSLLVTLEKSQNVGEGGTAKINYWSVPWRFQLKIMDSNSWPPKADGGMGRHGHF